MGQPFNQQTVTTDSDIEEEEVTREDQLLQDLLQVWEVLVDEYIRWEVE